MIKEGNPLFVKIFLLYVLAPIFARADLSEFYKIERAADLWNKDSLISMHDEILEKVQLEEAAESRLLLSILNYWLSGYYWSKSTDSSKFYLEEMVEILGKVPDNEKTPEDWAFLGYGYNTLIPLKGFLYAPLLSKRSEKAFEKAIEKGAKNPRVFLLKGISLFHTPEVFGGGVDKALKFLNCSIELYKDDPGPVRWGKKLSLLYKARALKELNNGEEAIQLLKNIVSEYPDFNWAKSLLSKWESELK